MKFKVLGFLGVVMFILSFISVPAFAQYFGYYVLDGYGGVHAGGGAPAITPATPYFGWDIAKAIAYVPVGYNSAIYGEGYVVLDGYGGIHRGGQLASIAVTATPYFGWDIARDLTMRLIPPRANGSTYIRDLVIKTGYYYTSVAGANSLYLPDDGYVILNGCVVLQNQNATTSIVNYGFSTDGTNTISGFRGYQDIHPSSTDTVSLTQFVFLEAGYHTFRFMIMLAAGTNIRYEHASMSALYIDQSATGHSAESKIEE